MANFLTEIWQAFKDGYNGAETEAQINNRGTTANTMAEFINEPSAGPRWTEAEIMAWIKGHSPSDQEEIRQAAKESAARGVVDTHTFLCMIRKSEEESAQEACFNGSGGNIDGLFSGFWEQYQLLSVLKREYWKK